MIRKVKSCRKCGKPILIKKSERIFCNTACKTSFFILNETTDLNHSLETFKDDKYLHIKKQIKWFIPIENYLKRVKMNRFSLFTTDVFKLMNLYANVYSQSREIDDTKEQIKSDLNRLIYWYNKTAKNIKKCYEKEKTIKKESNVKKDNMSGIRKYDSKKGMRYRVIITFRKQQIYLGTFDSLDDAKKARYQKRKELTEEFKKSKS